MSNVKTQPNKKSLWEFYITSGTKSIQKIKFENDARVTMYERLPIIIFNRHGHFIKNREK